MTNGTDPLRLHTEEMQLTTHRNLMSLDALLVVSLAFFMWGCQQERPLDAPLLTVPDNAVGTQIDSGVANAEAYLSPTAVLARIA